jgi:hypothetical protein
MTKTTYFKKYTGKSYSLVDALISVGCKDTSKAYRTKIAKLNGIQGYTGLASQNKTMLTMLKAGKLIKSVTKTYPMREKFIGMLQKYNPVIKKYGKQITYSFDDSEPTFEEAKKRLKAGKKTGMTCVVPCRWALKDIGISPSGFYAKNGSFKDCYKGDIKKHLERITSGGAIGKTVKQAANDGLLKPGDIIAYKGKTHTFVYSGIKCKVYDGGRYGSHTKDGILFDYGPRTEKISEILRWID